MVVLAETDFCHKMVSQIFLEEVDDVGDPIGGDGPADYLQYLQSLLSFFLKRQVFTLQSVTHNQQISTNFLTLLGFLGECVDQRDNRLVTKSLKTLHIALGWSTGELKGELQSFGEKFKSIRKQTSRKILLLVQQLTLADEDLLR